MPMTNRCRHCNDPIGPDYCLCDNCADNILMQVDEAVAEVRAKAHPRNTAEKSGARQNEA